MFKKLKMFIKRYNPRRKVVCPNGDLTVANHVVVHHPNQEGYPIEMMDLSTYLDEYQRGRGTDIWSIRL